MKPIQTGTNLQRVLDIEFVYRTLGQSFELDEVCPYRFPEPLSPLLAAQLAGEKIEIGRVLGAYERLRENHEFIVVEGAGGMLVPITYDYFMSDLAKDMGLPVIIVARPGLGTLNHTLLTVEHTLTKGLEPLGVVIGNFPCNPSMAERTNIGILSALSDAPILGVIPEGLGIVVEEGRVGNIGSIAKRSLSEELCGSFSLKEFIDGLWE